MSDLQCAATIVLARHGEAEYDVGAAESWPDAGGSLTELGRRQARSLGESLLDRRVASVWTSDLARAVQTAEIAAAVLGLPVRVRTPLREFGVGRPDETADDLVARVSGELQAIADLGRGETALVVSHGGAIEHTVPRLAGVGLVAAVGSSAGEPFGNGATCELEADGDGWTVRSWQGRPVG